MILLASKAFRWQGGNTKFISNGRRFGVNKGYDMEWEKKGELSRKLAEGWDGLMGMAMECVLPTPPRERRLFLVDDCF
jgi:hypothetical protein